MARVGSDDEETEKEREIERRKEQKEEREREGARRARGGRRDYKSESTRTDRGRSAIGRVTEMVTVGWLR